MENVRRCEFCSLILLAYEFERHYCREMPQSSGDSRALVNPTASNGASVIRHTSDIESNPPKVINMSYLKKCCSFAVSRIQARIQPMIPHISAGPSTSFSRGRAAETRKHRRPLVNTTPFNHFVYRPSVIINTNKPYSIPSQTSNVSEVNSKEAGTSSSKLMTGECAAEPPERATEERAVPNSGVQRLLESSATEMARIQLQIKEQNTTSSRPLGSTSAQETARASVGTTFNQIVYRPVPLTLLNTRSLSGLCRPPIGNGSLHAPQENSEQAAATDRVTERLVGEPPGNSEGACTAPILRNMLSGQAFYCRLCRLLFTSSENLDRHIDKLIEDGVPNAMAHHHTPQYRRPGFFVCQICQEHFDTKSALDDHCESHRISTPHKCLFCKMRYMTHQGLSSHESKMHKQEPIYKCQRCHKRHFNQTDLGNHYCDP